MLPPNPILAASLLDPETEHTDTEIMDALKKLKYPVLLTTKKDGIRALKASNLVSRRLKLIPNDSIRKRAMRIPSGFDMELYNPTLPYYEIESRVMSQKHEKEDEIEFHCLDLWNSPHGYGTRMAELDLMVAELNVSDVIFEMPKLCLNAEDVMKHILRVESVGGEGVCFRSPNGRYKNGRSTLKEQLLVKFSRYVRSEAKIVGFEEQTANCNTANVNALGYTERSSHQHRLLGKNTLGAFIVDWNGQRMTVGTGVGLTEELRQKVWDNREEYIDKLMVIKHKACGMKIKPRSPIMIGFRSEIDL